MKVKLRFLTIEDAEISWNWRNDPAIWNLTGRKWNNVVTEDIEKKWLKDVLKKEDEIRFAICVGENEEYVGNVQLTGITNEDAEFHIFIGNKSYWGKGIASKATKLVVIYAKKELHLGRLHLFVKKTNEAALAIYKKNSFQILQENEDEYLMICDLNTYV